MTRTDDGSDARDDELLSAFMDGELDAASAAEVGQRLESEPALARRLEALRGVDVQLRAAFMDTDERVPGSLRELIANGSRDQRESRSGTTAQVIPFARVAALSRRWAPLAAAASVVFVVGLMLGRGPVPGGNGDPGLLAGQTPLLPGSVLHEVVTTLPSGQTRTLADGRVVTPEYTFRTAAGSVCRRLAVSSDHGMTTAVTCREGDDWRVRLARFAPGATVDYAPAFGRSDPFDLAVDAMMDDAPLDAADERAALVGDGHD